VEQYPFARLLLEVFQLVVAHDDQSPAVAEKAVAQPDAELGRIHENPPSGCPLHQKFAKVFVDSGVAVPGEWRQYNSHLTAKLEESQPWQEFLATYRRFVREVAAPLSGTDKLVFQCPPTLRIVMPNAPATIQRHCDADYPLHRRGEINFWLPATSVGGANSLQLESAPGRGDYRAMELGYGEILRFNGYENRHYTVRNDTSTTRISFDWRAIPAELVGDVEITAFGDYPAERSWVDEPKKRLVGRRDAARAKAAQIALVARATRLANQL